MDAQALFVLKIIFTVLAGCAGVLAAWFELRDRMQTKEDRQKTRAWYGAKWRTIRDSGVLKLPETVITWLLGAKIAVARFGKDWANMLPRKLSFGIVYTSPFLMGVAGWIEFGWVGGFALAATTTGFTVLFYVERGAPAKVNYILGAMGLIGLIGWALGAVVCVKAALSLSVAHAALGFIVALPILGIYFCSAVVGIWAIARGAGQLEYRNDGTGDVFGSAMAVSFAVTMCSLWIGNAVAPDAWIPQTLQMLGSNVIFDGFTMLATFAILARAIGEKRKYPIPVAVVMDVAIAALFACASLWFGLVRTENALSITQVVKILIGQSPDGAGYDLGPYFWAMHTTFLPTLAYMAVILLCWIGKLLILPVAKVLMKGEAVDKPHHLTAGVFGVLFAIFIGIVWCIGLAEEAARRRASETVNQVIERQSCVSPTQSEDRGPTLHSA